MQQEESCFMLKDFLYIVVELTTLIRLIYETRIPKTSKQNCKKNFLVF